VDTKARFHRAAPAVDPGGAWLGCVLPVRESARHFDKIRNHALERLALVIAKRHHRSRAYGWSVVAFQSPNQLGLVDLNGIGRRPQTRTGLAGKTACRR
jgi:RNA-directed DNA polymerase